MLLTENVNYKELNYCGAFTTQEVVTVSWFHSVMLHEAYGESCTSLWPYLQNHLGNLAGEAIKGHTTGFQEAEV